MGEHSIRTLIFGADKQPYVHLDDMFAVLRDSEMQIGLQNGHQDALNVLQELKRIVSVLKKGCQLNGDSAAPAEPKPKKNLKAISSFYIRAKRSFFGGSVYLNKDDLVKYLELELERHISGNAPQGEIELLQHLCSQLFRQR